MTVIVLVSLLTAIAVVGVRANKDGDLAVTPATPTKTTSSLAMTADPDPMAQNRASRQECEQLARGLESVGREFDEALRQLAQARTIDKIEPLYWRASALKSQFADDLAATEFRPAPELRWGFEDRCLGVWSDEQHWQLQDRATQIILSWGDVADACLEELAPIGFDCLRW